MDKAGKASAPLADQFSPASLYGQGNLSQVFPDATLQPLLDAARAERALSAQGGPMGASAEKANVPAPEKTIRDNTERGRRKFIVGYQFLKQR